MEALASGLRCFGCLSGCYGGVACQRVSEKALEAREEDAAVDARSGQFLCPRLFSVVFGFLRYFRCLSVPFGKSSLGAVPGVLEIIQVVVQKSLKNL